MKLCVNKGDSDQETLFLVCRYWGHAFPTSGDWVDEKCCSLLPLGRNCRLRMQPVRRKGVWGHSSNARDSLFVPRFSIFLNKCFCLLYALMTISRDFFKNIKFTSYGCFTESVDLLMLPF